MTTAAAPTKIPAAPTWDLDSIFPGGSTSEKFKTFREQTKAKLNVLKALANALPVSTAQNSLAVWVEFWSKLQVSQLGISALLSFDT